MKKQKPTATGNQSGIRKQGMAGMVIERLFLSVLASFILGALIKTTDITATVSASVFFSPSNLINISVISGLVFILILALLSYGILTSADWIKNTKLLLVIFASLIITYGFVVLCVRYVSLYSAPVVLAPLLVSALVSKRVGIISAVLLNLILFLNFMIVAPAVDMFEASSLILSLTISAIFIITFMSRTASRINFICVAFIAMVISFASPVLTVLLSNGGFSAGAMGYAVAYTAVSAVLSFALFMLVLPLMETLFRVATNFRLGEIASLNSPLLKKLSIEAPGTFNHCLVVGNLAEQCAASIGENAFLAKVCAYYHDVGKIKKPDYFTENQQGYNPHDDVIPEISVKIITDHTSDGPALIRKYRLPDIVEQVAREHHGTMPVSYFYYKAQRITEDSLTSDKFSYTDPKPSTKISAIVMIADTVEAATRAMGLSGFNNSSGELNQKEFRAFIRKLIKDKADSNQFSECPITFKDLQKIEDTLTSAVPSIYHARIKYDKK
ncbi:MAG: HDIG domain-containing protein [Firmicutes bacterium]|nr:HDIG domain-containing protein [Bacillota bacterium]